MLDGPCSWLLLAADILAVASFAGSMLQKMSLWEVLQYKAGALRLRLRLML